MRDPMDRLKIHKLNEAAVHFEAYEKGYWILLESGRRLDAVRAACRQPPIRDFDDYDAHLLVETLDAFYILKQRVVDGRPGPWTAVGWWSGEGAPAFSETLEGLDRAIERFAGDEADDPAGEISGNESSIFDES